MVIDGMDFGWDHPQSRVQLAIDMEAEIFYVTKAWKASKTSPAFASERHHPAKKYPAALTLTGHVLPLYNGYCQANALVIFSYRS
ncbi:hypothetical protein MJM95_29985, partial [Salmonella enterica subsp. enterica serovar Anatum]|nr:hypothetical protein [Salmonella enterica subsp. enterica serovar Anatum]